MSHYTLRIKLIPILKFQRELPEPVLESSEIISRFEQAASTKELTQRESQLTDLANQQLSESNRVLLAWITLHLDHVIAFVSNFIKSKFPRLFFISTYK